MLNADDPGCIELGRRLPGASEWYGLDDPHLLASTDTAPDLAAAVRGRRQVWFADGGWQSTPIYARERLPLGLAVPGPAIVEQLDTTVVLEPGNRATPDPLGNLIVEVTP